MASLTQRGTSIIEIMHEEVSNWKDQRGMSSLNVASDSSDCVLSGNPSLFIKTHELIRMPL